MTATSPRRVIALTPAQRLVLGELTKDGATNGAIAERLGLNEHTVKSHMKAILNEFGTSNRTAIAVAVLRHRVLIGSHGSSRSTTTHLGPHPGAELIATGCCHRLIRELPGSDGVTRAPDRVTCGKVGA